MWDVCRGKGWGPVESHIRRVPGVRRCTLQRHVVMVCCCPGGRECSCRGGRDRMHIGGEKGDGWMPACRGCVGAALSHVRGRRARGGSSAATSTAWEHTPHAAFLLQGEMCTCREIHVICDIICRILGEILFCSAPEVSSSHTHTPRLPHHGPPGRLGHNSEGPHTVSQH